jgi:hypothetical protein
LSLSRCGLTATCPEMEVSHDNWIHIAGYRPVLPPPNDRHVLAIENGPNEPPRRALRGGDTTGKRSALHPASPLPYAGLSASVRGLSASVRGPLRSRTRVSPLPYAGLSAPVRRTPPHPRAGTTHEVATFGRRPLRTRVGLSPPARGPVRGLPRAAFECACRRAPSTVRVEGSCPCAVKRARGWSFSPARGVAWVQLLLARPGWTVTSGVGRTAGCSALSASDPGDSAHPDSLSGNGASQPATDRTGHLGAPRGAMSACGPERTPFILRAL